MTAPAGKLPRWLLALGGLALLGVAIYGLRGVLTPIFFAFMIAYLLDPLVDRFEKRVPRAVGIVLVLGIVLSALVLFVLLLLPSVVREVVAFGHELPEKLHGLQTALEPRLREYGVEMPHDLGELRTTLSQYLGGAEGDEGKANEELATRAASALGTIGQWVWGGTSTLLGVLTSLLVVPVLAFYLLHDFDRITEGIRDLIPHRYRPFVVDVASEIDQVLGQFIRGQLMVMVILAVLYSVAYSIAGIRLAIPIGIVAGLLSFIPYVGGAAALLLGLLMCALGFESWWQVGGVVVGYGIIQALEGTLITPRIVGDKVGLPAVWVLVALMIGGELFGFLGVLLAVPAAAVAKIFVMRAVAHYRKSDLYLEGHAAREGVLVGFLKEEGLPDDPAVAEAKSEAYDEWPEEDAIADGRAVSSRDEADEEADSDAEAEAEADEPGHGLAQEEEE